MTRPENRIEPPRERPDPTRPRWLGLLGGGLLTATSGCAGHREHTARRLADGWLRTREHGCPPEERDGRLAPRGDVANRIRRRSSTPKSGNEVLAVAVDDSRLYLRDRVYDVATGEEQWRYRPGTDGSERWRGDAPATPVVQPAGAVSVGAGHLYVAGQTDALAGALRAYDVETE